MSDGDKKFAQAATDLYELICERSATEKGVHIETAIASAGYLSGATILLECGVELSKLAPGAPSFAVRLFHVRFHGTPKPLR